MSGKRGISDVERRVLEQLAHGKPARVEGRVARSAAWRLVDRALLEWTSVDGRDVFAVTGLGRLVGQLGPWDSVHVCGSYVGPSRETVLADADGNAPGGDR